MPLAVVYSRASAGVDAPLVTVEAHITYGMAGFFIVGLPAKAVKESKDRIRSAFIHSELEFPDRRITINLAPADLPKEGGRFDLPIALGILAATNQIPLDVLTEYEWVGELALSGELRAVKGILPIVHAARRANRKLIVPKHNAAEAALVKQCNVLSAATLLDVVAHMRGEKVLAVCQAKPAQDTREFHDISDVRGQAHAKRALEIAAAGRHSLLLIGPPGTGKTMLATRLPGILPPMSEEHALEVAAVASVSHNGFDPADWLQTPFRSPHHSSSSMALVGGGSPPTPGEISLAHQGVLFLDELPQFHRHVLETLREPLESGFITISRAGFQRVYPAQFQFIAAMNPCPCGYAGLVNEECVCTSEQVLRYMAKISGPLLDRMDMHVEVARLAPEFLSEPAMQKKTNPDVRERVIVARQRQLSRQQKLNYALTGAELNEVATLETEAQQMLTDVMIKFGLSARVYHRIVKLARTIADLAASTCISTQHVSEALSYRCLDRRVVR